MVNVSVKFMAKDVFMIFKVKCRVRVSAMVRFIGRFMAKARVGAMARVRFRSTSRAWVKAMSGV
jgi:hypothetical protein